VAVIAVWNYFFRPGRSPLTRPAHPLPFDKRRPSSNGRPAGPISCTGRCGARHAEPIRHDGEGGSARSGDNGQSIRLTPTITNWRTHRLAAAAATHHQTVSGNERTRVSLWVHVRSRRRLLQWRFLCFIMHDRIRNSTAAQRYTFYAPFILMDGICLSF
jgi:hypothetical protein